MISSKKWKANGNVKRFLSEFIIQTEQHVRVYNYVHDEINGSDVTDIIDPTTGLYLRKSDYPQSNDLVSLEKFDLANNSILFYVAPKNTVSVYIEIATTPEEFGGTIAQPAADQAQGYASEAEEYLDEIKELYMGGLDTAPITGMVPGSMYFDLTENILKNWTGQVWISPKEMLLADVSREVFTASNNQTVFVLSNTNDNNVNVYFNGILQPEDAYTIVDNVITFNEIVEDGYSVEFILFKKYDLFDLSLQTLSVTILDDSVAEVIPFRQGTFMNIMYGGNSIYPQFTFSGEFFLDVGTSPMILATSSNVGGSIIPYNNHELDGTTGADDKINLNARDNGTLQIENRTGSTCTLQISFR